MRAFDIRELARLLHEINEAKAYAVKMCEVGNRDAEVPEMGLKSLVYPLVVRARNHAKQGELYSTLDRVADETGYFQVALSEGISFQALQHQLTVLREAIEADLAKRHFVFICSEKAKALEGMPFQ